MTMNNDLINELLKNKKIKDFLKENKLSKEDILKNLSAFTQFNEQDPLCEKCDGNCIGVVEGARVELVFDNGKVRVEYFECEKQIIEDEEKLELIDYTPTDLGDIYETPERQELFNTLSKVKDAIDIYDFYNSSEPCKGIYLYGSLGSGKSFIMYRFAKKLSKKHKVVFAYYPDLVRRITSSLTDGYEMEAMISKVKTCDILFLDDIGRENNTGFVRDSILGPILQHRCDNNLPVFFTSNRSFSELENHLAYANGVTDLVKGKALVARIKYLSNECKLVDKDFRNK